jgi:hypothetical protein
MNTRTLTVIPDDGKGALRELRAGAKRLVELT